MKPIRHILAFILCLSSAAHALNSQLFRPAQTVGEGIWHQSSQSLTKGQYQASAFLNWVGDPLVYSTTGSASFVESVVEHAITANLTAGYGIMDWLALEIDLPIHIFNDIVNIATFEEEKSVSLGDLMLRAIIQIKKRNTMKESEWGFALVPFITLALESQGQFLRNESLTAGARLIADKWLTDRSYLGFNLGGRYRDEETLANLSLGSELLAGATFSHILSPKQHFDAVFEINAATNFKDENTSPVEASIAVRKRWADNRWAFMFGGGRGLDNGVGAPDFRLFTGITYRSGKKTPKPVDEQKQMQERVEKQKLEDPSLEVLMTNIQGAPVSGNIEIIGNGINEKRADNSFKKILPPGTYTINAEAPGYLWSTRQVTVEPGGEHIEDITMVEAKAGNKIQALGKIMFDFDSARLRSESYEVLDNIVEVMNRSQSVKKLRIEAHTDAKGADSYNLSLSKRRAKSVYNYLKDNGVSSSRLESRGYGETQPIADNDSEEGRRKNRRVEFTILDGQQ